MRILLAVADRAERNELAASLEQWGYRVVVALDGVAAAATLRGDDAPTLAILSSGLAERPADVILRAVRENGAPTYFLYVAERSQPLELQAALAAGADDFLYRPYDEHEVKARLRAARRVVDLQRAARDAQDAFRHEARHDQLTGALNRPAILEILRQELDRASREHGSVGAVVVDVDGFRGINEAHGHAAADAVLREVTRRLAALARTYDGIGRHATSEFLLVLPGCDAVKAAALGDRVRVALSSSPVRVRGLELAVTASIGTASSRDGTHAEALVQAAATASDEAASAGGNCVRAAGPPTAVTR